MSKWEKVAELTEAANENKLDDLCYRSKLKCVGYAPHMGYRSWLFRYKGLFVSLWDLGNDHWDLHSVATLWDYLLVRFGKKVK